MKKRKYKRHVDSMNYYDGNYKLDGGYAYATGFAINWQRGRLFNNKSGEEVGRNGALIDEVLWACLQRLKFYRNCGYADENDMEALRHVRSAVKMLDDARDRNPQEDQSTAE